VLVLTDATLCSYVPRCAALCCRCGALEAANVELKKENAALTAAQQKQHKARQ
jgi:hypothetical protein